MLHEVESIRQHYLKRFWSNLSSHRGPVDMATTTPWARSVVPPLQAGVAECMLYCTPHNQTLQQHMSSMAFRVVGKLWICIGHLLDMLAVAAGTLQRSLQRMSTIHLRCMITLMITIIPAHQAAINSHQRTSTCMWIRHTCRHLHHHRSSAWCVACNGLVLRPGTRVALCFISCIWGRALQALMAGKHC